MRFLATFVLRWIVTSFGLWIAVWVLGGDTATAATDTTISVYLFAGFILSLVNIFIKPIVSLLSLPFTILTLGLFTLVINGLMVYIALRLTPGLEMSFWSAVLAGIIIGIVNYAINATLETLKTVK